MNFKSVNNVLLVQLISREYPIKINIIFRINLENQKEDSISIRKLTIHQNSMKVGFFTTRCAAKARQKIMKNSNPLIFHLRSFLFAVETGI